MYEPWSQLHANLMLYAATRCLHHFAKVELSRRGRKARHRAAFTTLKKIEERSGDSVVEGKDCPELVIVAESRPFLLLPTITSQAYRGTSRKGHQEPGYMTF